tara:strand:+ start:5024 stop:5830 length:807 start_codon:yes stop_codon:yes gene_type:complete
MKLKIYMVTYKGHTRLNPTLTSLFGSDLVDHDYELNIINNHTDIRLPEQFEGKVNIIHNSLRPDFSWGHLSRNWNQALINGFESLAEPACDIVVCTQDDSIFRKEWVARLLSAHERFDFVQNGHGDQFHSYKPEAVRKVGLWDERYIMSRHAADYFWRCVMHNKDKSSFQDPRHHRIWNPLFPGEPIEKSWGWLVDPDPRQIDASTPANPLDLSMSEKLMAAKFPFDPFPWTIEKIMKAPDRTITDNHILYPYFEKDVYDLQGKGFIT